MDITDRFLDIYKQIEDIAETIYGPSNISQIARLERMPQFKNSASALRCCREIRNILQHNAKINGDHVLRPNESLLNLLENILGRLQNPILACDIAVKTKDVYHRALSSPVIESMHYMINNDISKLPILDNGRIIGLFSQETLFYRAISADLHPIDKNTRFYHIKDFLHINEKYYRFAPYDARIEEIENIFSDASSRRIRIHIIFLTNSGDPNENLLGIITPWELIDKA